MKKVKKSRSESESDPYLKKTSYDFRRNYQNSWLRSGAWLENLIFGSYADGSALYLKFHGEKADFQRDLERIMENYRGQRFPKTRIGESLYFMIWHELRRLGINPEGLVFCSAVDTIADLVHKTDGFLFVPAIPTHPIILDAFSINTDDLMLLKDRWMYEFEGEIFTEKYFRSKLFLYKAELRMSANDRRHENEFVITPYDISTSQRRKEFARLIAHYWHTVQQEIELEKQTHKRLKG